MNLYIGDDIRAKFWVFIILEHILFMLKFAIAYFVPDVTEAVSIHNTTHTDTQTHMHTQQRTSNKEHSTDTDTDEETCAEACVSGASHGIVYVDVAVVCYVDHDPSPASRVHRGEAGGGSG